MKQNKLDGANKTFIGSHQPFQLSFFSKEQPDISKILEADCFGELWRIFSFDLNLK